MRRIATLSLFSVLLLGSTMYALGDPRDEAVTKGVKPVHVAAKVRKPAVARVVRPAPQRQPVVIHMNRPGNVAKPRPVQKAPAPAQVNKPAPPSPKPMQMPVQKAPAPAQVNKQAPPGPKPMQMPVRKSPALAQVKAATAPGARTAKVIHHQVYTKGYVRQKLTKIGVKTEPAYITNRSDIVSADRAHSVIKYPRVGPKGAPIKGTLVSPRLFNGKVVREQMATLNHPDYKQQIERERSAESRRNHTYWHSDKGFDYAHFVDGSGQDWYGWYGEDQYFWTRNYNGRWWWYDSGFNRWCFYNDDYWWWQDPNHVGELYCYDDENYIPANSADDQVVVDGLEQTNDKDFKSPDGTRSVKITKGDGDAFLYDLGDPPTFNPIYMASGVQSVQFSSADNGRPIEIVLKLNDGSYDMFDSQGNPYNSQAPQAQ